MKKSLKQKSIAVFLVLLIGMVLTVGAVSAQENIKESGIGEEIAVSNPEINMSLKPVFDLTVEQVTELTEKGIIKYYPDGTRVVNLYGALKEIKGNQSLTINDIEAEIKSGEYRHAFMKTWHWLWGDQYKYRGHKVYVKIPANVNLNPQTSFNLYNTHMVIPSGKFFESGVGWFNSWGLTGLHIYTYDSYTGDMYSKAIPSGTSRDIFLRVLSIYQYGQNRGYMWAEDPQSGQILNTFAIIDGLDHKVDETQEQHSSLQVWTSTPQAKHHDNIIKNQNDQWVNWDSTISTGFWAESPMKETHGIESNTYYITTWCQP